MQRQTFWWGVGVLIGALLCLWGYFYEKAETAQYQKSGISSQAVVLDKYIKTTHNANTDEDERTYVLKLSFKAGSQGITDERFVSEDTYKAFDKDKAVPILYLADKPAEFRVAAKTEEDQVFMFAFFTGLFSLVGVGLIGFALWAPKPAAVAQAKQPVLKN